MYPREFQDKMVQDMATVVAGQKEVLRRLDNGEKRFESLHTAIDENRMALVNHAVNCPLKGEVSEIKVNIQSHTAAIEGSRNTWKLLNPYLYLIIVVILSTITTLVLSHSGIFAKAATIAE